MSVPRRLNFVRGLTVYCFVDGKYTGKHKLEVGDTITDTDMGPMLNYGRSDTGDGPLEYGGHRPRGVGLSSEIREKYQIWD